MHRSPHNGDPPAHNDRSQGFFNQAITVPEAQPRSTLFQNLFQNVAILIGITGLLGVAAASLANNVGNRVLGGGFFGCGFGAYIGQALMTPFP